jgi:hypothetical protein
MSILNSTRGLRAAGSDQRDAGSFQFQFKKRGAQRLPFPIIRDEALRSGNPSRRALNLASVEAASAHLDLCDLAIDYNPGDLKIRLPGAARLVVRVRDVVPVRDALVAHVAAVSLDLRHIVNLPSG